MGFNNLYMLGVTKDGFTFLTPPRPSQRITDADAIELAALIVAMKPHLLEQFQQTLARIQEGA